MLHSTTSRSHRVTASVYEKSFYITSSWRNECNHCPLFVLACSGSDCFTGWQWRPQQEPTHTRLCGLVPTAVQSPSVVLGIWALSVVSQKKKAITFRTLATVIILKPPSHKCWQRTYEPIELQRDNFLSTKLNLKLLFKDCSIFSN